MCALLVLAALMGNMRLLLMGMPLFTHGTFLVPNPRTRVRLRELAGDRLRRVASAAPALLQSQRWAAPRRQRLEDGRGGLPRRRPVGWRSRCSAPTSRTLISLVHSPAEQLSLFAVRGGGAYISRDGGQGEWSYDLRHRQWQRAC